MEQIKIEGETIALDEVYDRNGLGFSSHVVDETPGLWCDVWGKVGEDYNQLERL